MAYIRTILPTGAIKLESSLGRRNVQIRPTTHGIRAFLHAVKIFNLRVQIHQPTEYIKELADIERLKELRSLIAQQNGGRIPPGHPCLSVEFPRWLTVYAGHKELDGEELVKLAVSWLESNYDKKGKATLISWEYVKDASIPWMGSGASTQDMADRAKRRPPLPKSEHLDNGRSMDAEERRTGKRHISGRKYAPGEVSPRDATNEHSEFLDDGI